MLIYQNYHKTLRNEGVSTKLSKGYTYMYMYHAFYTKQMPTRDGSKFVEKLCYYLIFIGIK